MQTTQTTQTTRRSWTDEQLARAIRDAHSWRGVLRNLDLRNKNPEYVQRAARQLGLDTSHIGSPLRCSDDELAAALESSDSWPQLLSALGLLSGSQRGRAAVQTRAARLGLRTDHLTGDSPQQRRPASSELIPQLRYLRDAAEPLATAWFMLRGLWPAAPLEPRPYDLLLDHAGGITRVQVKSATSQESSGTWHARICRHAGGGKNHDRSIPYTSDEIDVFLLVNGDLTLYLIPLQAVAGRISILLPRYEGFRVGSASSLMRAPSSSHEPLFRPPRLPAPAAAADDADWVRPARAQHAQRPAPVPAPASPLLPEEPRWPEDQLRAAVAQATSWADLLVAFGFRPSSTSPRVALQREVQRFGIDTSHFTGQRTWSDQALIDAAPQARTWPDLYRALGLSATTRGSDAVQRAARRLGVSLDHLMHGPKAGPEATGIDLPGLVELERLRTAAGSIASAWFLLCGCEVSVPASPAPYDLVVNRGGRLTRVQVKTTTGRGRRGAWVAGIGHQPHGSPLTTDTVAYDAAEVDCFFVVDGDLMLYLIPISAVAGKINLTLRAYTEFIVGDASSLLLCGPPATPAQSPAASPGQPPAA